MKQLIEGQIIKSPLFSEPMRVETVRTDSSGTLTVGLVGTQTERFRRVILNSEQLTDLTILNRSICRSLLIYSDIAICPEINYHKGLYNRL
jgi:hypothetical protein